MRILVFHGYLLSGTGSNVYNARLAQALVALGHELHLLCQERHPERCDFAGAVADWDGGQLQVRRLDRAQDAGGGSCTLYRPDIGGLLPVYVQDRYEGIQARTFADCSDAEVAAYVRANVEAVREVVALVEPEIALANHLVMGPAILARALEGRIPFAVKVHGSALEYTVKPQPDRFLGYAREGLEQAKTVLVGSTHTAQSLWRAMRDAALPSRTRLGPPGVDVERFAPRDRELARVRVSELAGALCSKDGLASEDQASAFARDEQAAASALDRVAQADGPLVAFVGKLIVSKGVDLLLAAWPLVLQSTPNARLLVVGFGSYRAALEGLVDCLAAADLDGARAIARAGRAGEADSHGSETAPLRYLLAFLDSLADAEAYTTAARAMRERIVFAGRLDHEELAELLPLCEALVVPSTFPEAFGMVAAEAAACGALPVSAAHSGLAEVSETLAAAVPADARALLSFPLGEEAVPAIADCLNGWLAVGDRLREQTREALVAVVRERWSWRGVARGVVAAALGEPESPLARAVG
ncbi:MAG TPA: glycosyltransferase [Solirubrobacteraceae bacterium]|nr:glycosyltransferase [Solirubrobacteraceae bacterium]